jgi:hypothetical protein
MEQHKNADRFVISDAVTDLERRFPLKELLGVEYFKKYRLAYYKQRELGAQIGGRNYYNLLKFVAEIHEYRPEDAKALGKRLRTDGSEWRNCEAIFAEIIVYRYYVRLVYEGLIRSVRLGRSECDVIVERLDASRAFMELFSIMPDRKQLKPGESALKEYKTHTQNDPASIRQKLLRKIAKQGQMRGNRENYAVIELNDVSIAGDFAVLSSLSSGYKVTIDLESMKRVSEGYDWATSVFDDPLLRRLKGVIWFDLGDYDSRRILLNPMFGRPTHEEIARRAYELFEQRRRENGHDVDDWLEAERELLGS